MKVLQEAGKAVKNLYKNPILFVPDLFFYIVTYFMSIYFYKSTGIDVMLQSILLSEAAKVEIFRDFVLTNFFHLAVSILVFVLVTFVLGAGVDTIRFRMMKKILRQKKISLFNLIFRKNPYFFKIVFVKIYVYILTVFFVLVSTAIVVVNRQMEGGMWTLAFKIIFSLLGVAFILFIKAGILYRYAVLFMAKERRAYRAIKRSFKLMVQHPWPVLHVWAFLIFISVILWFLLSFLGLLSQKLQAVIVSEKGLMVLSLAGMLVLYLLRLIYDLWENMFLFRTYRPIKKSSRNL